jgi:hypothetical protein
MAKPPARYWTKATAADVLDVVGASVVNLVKGGKLQVAAVSETGVRLFDPRVVLVLAIDRMLRRASLRRRRPSSTRRK